MIKYHHLSLALLAYVGYSQVIDPIEEAFRSLANSLRIFTTVRVGSENQKFQKVAVDTSIGHLIVASIDCDLCTDKNTQYDYFQSNTSVLVDPLRTQTIITQD